MWTIHVGWSTKKCSNSFCTHPFRDFLLLGLKCHQRNGRNKSVTTHRNNQRHPRYVSITFGSITENNWLQGIARKGKGKVCLGEQVHQTLCLGTCLVLPVLELNIPPHVSHEKTRGALLSIESWVHDSLCFANNTVNLRWCIKDPGSWRLGMSEKWKHQKHSTCKCSYFIMPHGCNIWWFYCLISTK